MKSKSLLFVFLLMFFSFFFYINKANADITSNLWGHWTFDKGSGTTASETGTASGLTGTLDSLTTWATGFVGTHAVSIDSSHHGSDKVDFPSTNVFANADFVISLWVKPTDTPYILKAIFATSDGNGIYYMPNNHFGYKYDTNYFIDSGISVETDNWYHLVVVKSNNYGYLKIYVNGSPANEMEFFSELSPVTFRLGADYSSNGFYGIIDDLRIYNNRLTDSDVLELYNLNAPPPIVEPTLTLSPATNITRTSATLNATTIDDGGTLSIYRGFFYGTSTTPYDYDVSNSEYSSTGPFSKDVTNLICGNTYHYKAYSYNSVRTGSTTDGTFNTLRCALSVSNSPSYSWNPDRTSATINGLIDYNGVDILNKGFVYGIDDAFNNDISISTTSDFVYTISNIPCGTTYKFKSYASNPDGTVYSGPESINNPCPSPSRSSGRVYIAPTQTPIQTITPVIPISVTNISKPSAELSFRQVAPDVKLLQRYLNVTGYTVATSGPGSLNNETMYFGPATLRALIKFQKDKGIPATGYFGPITKSVVSGK